MFHYINVILSEAKNLNIDMYNTYYTYIMSSLNNTTIYVGVTNDLERRVAEHKSGLIPGFTQKYNCKKLVYFESFSDIEQAIAREKQLKGWVRKKKDALIDSMNPHRNDLAAGWNLDSSLRSEWQGNAQNDREMLRMTFICHSERSEAEWRI